MGATSNGSAPPSSVTLMRLALVLALFILAFPAHAETLVSFDALTTPPAAVRGFLARPAGAGPFPAVVLLHTCLGLPGEPARRSRRRSRARAMSRSSSTISRPAATETCTVDFPEALPRRLGAFALPQSPPLVDPSAHRGGGLFAGRRHGAQRSPLSPEHGFRAAAAFYPPCANVEGEKLAIPDPHPHRRSRRGDAGRRLRAEFAERAARGRQGSSSIPAPTTSSTIPLSPAERRALWHASANTTASGGEVAASTCCVSCAPSLGRPGDR